MANEKKNDVSVNGADAGPTGPPPTIPNVGQGLSMTFRVSDPAAVAEVARHVVERAREAGYQPRQVIGVVSAAVAAADDNHGNAAAPSAPSTGGDSSAK